MGLGYIVKMGAAEMEEYLKANYCPTLPEEHQGQCEQNLADNYVAMLQMIVNHFFVDGAGHICLAWGVCQPREVAALIGTNSPDRSPVLSVSRAWRWWEPT